MMTDSLFDMDSVRRDSPRLTAIREADIQTHFSPDSSPQWMAIPMAEAKRVATALSMAGPEDEWDSMSGITASLGNFLDRLGLIFEGNTKEDVEDQALAFLGTQQPEKP